MVASFQKFSWLARLKKFGILNRFLFHDLLLLKFYFFTNPMCNNFDVYIDGKIHILMIKSLNNMQCARKRKRGGFCNIQLQSCCQCSRLIHLLLFSWYINSKGIRKRSRDTQSRAHFLTSYNCNEVAPAGSPRRRNNATAHWR